VPYRSTRHVNPRSTSSSLVWRYGNSHRSNASDGERCSRANGNSPVHRRVRPPRWTLDCSCLACDASNRLVVTPSNAVVFTHSIHLDKYSVSRTSEFLFVRRASNLQFRGITSTGGIANRWTTSIHTNTYTSRTDFEYHGCALGLTGSGGAGCSDRNQSSSQRVKLRER
jgi:hypothetical protein